MRDQPAGSLAKDSAARDLHDPDACLPESLLLRLLTDFPGDRTILDAMIARPSLPPAIVVRLAELLEAPLRAQLLARHSLPAHGTGEARTRKRERPAWWTTHLTTMFR